MALKAVASGGGSGGGLVGSAGAFSIQLSNAAGAVVDGTYFITQIAPFAMTLTIGAAFCTSGSFDMELVADGLSVTGSVTTVSGSASLTFTANNSVSLGGELLLIVSNSTGNPPDANVQVTFTRDSV